MFTQQKYVSVSQIPNTEILSSKLYKVLMLILMVYSNFNFLWHQYKYTYKCELKWIMSMERLRKTSPDMSGGPSSPYILTC